MGCYRGCPLSLSSSSSSSGEREKKCVLSEDIGYTKRFIPQVSQYAKKVFVNEEEIERVFSETDEIEKKKKKKVIMTEVKVETKTDTDTVDSESGMFVYMCVH
jgi:DNA repair exonuclease SbcCD nuclease subunit